MQSRFAFFGREPLPDVRGAQEQQTADKRGHLDRIVRVREALAGDSGDVWTSQAEERVVFGYEAGKVVAATGRYAVRLEHAEGERVVDQMNAARRIEHDHRNALRVGRGERLESFEPLYAAHLPDLKTAHRMAYGLEKRADLVRTVTDAFQATAVKRDGGIAFMEGLAAGGLILRSDQARRLHIVDGAREHRLDQFVSDRDQERYLPAFTARKRLPGVEIFKSVSDRQDARDAKAERIAEQQLARQMVAAVQPPIRAIQNATRAATTVAAGPARAVGGLAQGVANLVTGFGKFQEAAKAAPAPAPAARAVPAPVMAAAELRRQNVTARPDENTKQLAAMHNGSVGEELRTTLRRLEEENRKLNDERAPDGSRGRERSR
jgi:hypothetical protein